MAVRRAVLEVRHLGPLPVVELEDLRRLQGLALEGLHRLDPDAWERVTLDLGEVRGFDYYSGLRIRIWVPGVADPVARGGRYNDLLERYGAPLAATGVAFDLDALEAAALAARSPQPHADARQGGVVLGLGPAALGLESRLAAAERAAGLRGEGRRAWVQGGVALERLKSMARESCAGEIVFFPEPAAGEQFPIERRFIWRESAWVEHLIAGGQA